MHLHPTVIFHDVKIVGISPTHTQITLEREQKLTTKLPRQKNFVRSNHSVSSVLLVCAAIAFTCLTQQAAQCVADIPAEQNPYYTPLISQAARRWCVVSRGYVYRSISPGDGAPLFYAATCVSLNEKGMNTSVTHGNSYRTQFKQI